MSNKERYAREVLRAGRELGISPRGIVIAFATVSVECDWIMYANAKVPESLSLPHERVGSDGKSVGLFQQQVVWGNGAWWWGDAATCMDPYKSAVLFFQRLTKRDYNHGDMGAHAQAVQGSAFPDRYATRMAEAQRLYDQLTSDTKQPEESMAPKGDPVWLEDALRKRLGDRLIVEPDWKERGAGGVMGEIWGVMIHHTGNVNERMEVIRDGVQQPSGWLPGPLSQALIYPNGKFHLIAVGPCNHAGGGKYGSLTNGNRDSIGFECAYSGSGRWPDAQILTMRDASRAVLEYCGHGSDRVCGHKEYALPAGRKVDPGNMDMNWFRREVAKALAGQFDAPQTDSPPAPPRPDHLREIWDQLRIEWPQLGGRTLVDAVAELLRRTEPKDS